MNVYLFRQLTPNVLDGNKRWPVVVLTGPRQSGKTTLCEHLYRDYSYANLDDITIRLKALDNPVGFLDSLGSKAIIEEIETVPELLEVISERVAEYPDRRYILTGRSRFTMPDALGGSAVQHTLLPLSLVEADYLVAEKSIDELIIGGLYPPMIAGDASFERYYRNYYNTYIERDLREHIHARNLLAFDRFIRLMAMRIGTEFNASALAREVGVTSVTIKEWYNILTDSYIAYPLQPYHHDGKSKPVTKMPKIYFYDTGLACYLLGIDREEQLWSHQMRGALFENLAINELLKNRCNRGNDRGVYFYRDKSGLEIDAVVRDEDTLRLYGIVAGHTVRRSLAERMERAGQALPGSISSTVIYEGESAPPATLNIRDI